MVDQGVESVEIERKYEVPGEAVVPGEFRVAGLTMLEEQTFELEARYFDTDDRLLAQHGIAVRLRLGGRDAGWHLKARTPAGTREVTWPPTDEVPETLIAELRHVTGQHIRELVHTATLRSTRVSRLLGTSEGQPSVELVDDSVLAHDHTSGVRRRWREWEAELIEGADPVLLDLMEPALQDAGALPSMSDSKIARALGKTVDLARARHANAGVLASLAISDVADRLAAAPEPHEATIRELRESARMMLAL